MIRDAGREALAGVGVPAGVGRRSRAGGIGEPEREEGGLEVGDGLGQRSVAEEPLVHQ